MPISASEYADRLAAQRRPKQVSDFKNEIEQWLEAALANNQSWCTISLSHLPLKDDAVLEAAAAFTEWECEITSGFPEGRQLHFTIPDHIKREKGLS